MAGRATQDRTGRLLGTHGAGLVGPQRIAEGFDQAYLCRGKIWIEPVELVQQHRMADAFDPMCQSGDSRSSVFWVLHLPRCTVAADLRPTSRWHWLDPEVLIPHRGGELLRLELSLPG